MSKEKEEGLFWYRAKLLGLVFVFLAPFVGGWMAFYVFDLRPASGNYGTLIQPVRQVEWPPLADSGGQQLSAALSRKWAFLLFIENSCDTQCRTNLFHMRQIKTLLGRDSERLQNVVISRQALSPEMRDYLVDFPRLLVIDGVSNSLIYRQFQLQSLDPVGSSAKTYLVDPAKNLMMHYPVESDQYRVLEDIKKLMKLSQIG